MTIEDLLRDIATGKAESRSLIDDAKHDRERASLSPRDAAVEVMFEEGDKARASYPAEFKSLNAHLAWQVEGWARGFEYMAPSSCTHDDNGWCYVVFTGNEFKIGSCRKATGDALASRLKGVQGMCPSPLRIVRVFTGGGRFERELHHRFARYRRHGEWFSTEIFGDLPYAGCEKCGYVVMPLDEHPERFLQALRIAVDEDMKLINEAKRP